MAATGKAVKLLFLIFKLLLLQKNINRETKDFKIGTNFQNWKQNLKKGTIFQNWKQNLKTGIKTFKIINTNSKMGINKTSRKEKKLVLID